MKRLLYNIPISLLLTVKATCTKRDYTCNVICSMCNENIRESEEIGQISHTVVKHGRKIATCEQTSYTGDDVCVWCDTVIARGHAVPMRGHGYSSTEFCNDVYSDRGRLFW